MTLQTVFSFWAVSLLFTLTPGLDWAFVLSAGMYRKAVVPAVSGLMSAHLLAAVLVAAGLGALVQQQEWVLILVTVAGALYLFYMGISILRNPPSDVQASDSDGGHSAAGWIARGFGVSGLNPKVFLLLLALLPQFASTGSSWSPSVQMLALGCLHVVSCYLVYLAVGFGAAAVVRMKPGAAAWIGRTSGVLMILIGIGFLLPYVKPYLGI